MGKHSSAKKTVSTFTPASHREVPLNNVDDVCAITTDKDIELCTVLSKDSFILFSGYCDDHGVQQSMLSTPLYMEKRNFYKN
ncbi:MAG: hypothetical protein WC346_16295 [Methanogenium sp.]|jgi:hypothetical protein